MKKQVFKTFALLAFTLVLATSCNKDADVTSSSAGEPTTLGVNFSVSDEETTLLGDAAIGTYSINNPGVATEEGTAPNYTPKDVWVMQYNGTTNAATLVGLPRYIVADAITGDIVTHAVTSTVPNTLVFVANTHDDNIEWGNISTLAMMKKACKTITAETDCYGNNGSATKDLVMSGTYTGNVTSGNINAELYRNIARIDFKLNNAAGSGMTLKSVQLCNVPCNFYWASSLIPATTLYPTVGDYMDYPAEDLSGAMNPGGTQTITWYMPLNQKGVVAASTDVKTKPNYAPSNSTFIRIFATDADNVAYVYKIYPGADMIKDFNLSSNHKYAVEITISSSGDASLDGRIENYGLVEFESANSYILNPAPAGTAARVFTIPIGRLNDFWAGKTPDRTIKEGTAWTAELLWQDTPTSDFIRFVKLSDGTLSTTQNGTGLNERIAVTTKAGYEGNALICIKVGGEILWSWHLWVTDYDPNYTADPVEGQYVYPVTGGNVHRYGGDFWDNLFQGRYFDKYIMDRNLGARKTDYGTVGVLYYQFGRKDPLPMFGYSNKLYDINGTNLNYDGNNTNAGSGVTIAESVLNPTKFYYIGSAENDWTNEGLYTPYAWNNIEPGLELKSIFDPCPPGWKLPVYGVWHDFVYKPTEPALLSTVLNVDRDPKLGWTYGGNKGMHYWPMNSDVAGEIYHPAVGMRHFDTGRMFRVSSNVYIWASTPNDVIFSNFRARSLLCTSTTVSFTQLFCRAAGMPVRCVQE